MNFNKIRSICRVVRIGVGAGLIGMGALSLATPEPQWIWFLGVVPMIAGIINFCPICRLTNKCELPN